VISILTLFYIGLFLLAVTIILGYRKHRILIAEFDRQRDEERRANRAAYLDDVEESISTISRRSWKQ
jgi:cell division protein FtsL